MDVRELLREAWGLADATVTPLAGGMNSETWRVEHRGAAYVLKRVPPSGLDDLAAGCAAASSLARAGLVTGCPVATVGGSLVDTTHGAALLQHVPGRELTGETAAEQRDLARTLAAAHRAGDPATRTGSDGFLGEWLSPRAPGVDAHPWLGPAVCAVVAGIGGLRLTWSLLHTDPAPEAFVRDDATGTTGLIDWSGARRGPVLYDVASAVMYLGGPRAAAPFLRTYAAAGVLGPGELDRLDAFRRVRWAVQAAYFARRLAAGDLTGLEDPAENQRGLDAARAGLRGLGVPTG